MAERSLSGFINVDAMVPETINFRMTGPDGKTNTYKVRGNIAASVAFDIGRKVDNIEKVRLSESNDLLAYLEACEQLHDLLLPLFQEFDPKMTMLPWDLAVIGRVGQLIMARAMGADAAMLSDLADMDGDTPLPNRATRRGRSSTSRNGSAASAPTSAARRRSG